MLDAWLNPFARMLRGSAIAFDEDYRREVLEERRAIIEADRAPIEDPRAELAVVNAVPCPECLARVGEPCHGMTNASHFDRTLAYARRGAS